MIFYRPCFFADIIRDEERAIGHKWEENQLPEITLCPECNVPQAIAQNYTWLDSGVMVQTNNKSRRVGFIESGNLDPLYEGVGKIIGHPIDDRVIDILRRGTIDYFKNILPGAGGMMRNSNVGTDFVSDFMMTMAQLNGFGKYEVLEIQYNGDGDDHTVLRVTNPFSVLLCLGSQSGGVEMISGDPHNVSYREVSPGVFEITARVNRKKEEPAESLQIEEYCYRGGDIELERCGTCRIPKVLGGFQWILKAGIIANGWTGRRMVMMGPEAQDPLFRELERQLGEKVPAAVIEAQRLFTKTGFYSLDEITNQGDFRTQLAVRGLGNLKRMKLGAKGLSMRIDDAACYFMTLGMAQGLFEMAFGLDSRIEWQISAEGDLELEVVPVI
ncbi:MAG: hypothetical protein A2V52_03875 [Actinobacteria bacterium RBG_19FT_COMBO_54_7]|uniref:Uncharacterized protein n=1 Tax=Candidatus Solincola sediminis TaxID=1797199 RepID=A0A1F2WF86_9ACTN|nr:MAG: hypothetical protein A2Y75_09255 [Candidatus Solincola sediminis]OFW57817.1 MAG: hypothetical protein A2W01_05230 [Candidatus Solincola sediminis]OFW68564.1 MAG: hypothetical protein A2V52_03875 [Actinobacteria bacterium RBG_19FT_COMBO_54_7]